MKSKIITLLGLTLCSSVAMAQITSKPIIPSSYHASEQTWEADVCVFGSGVQFFTDEGRWRMEYYNKVLDVPQADADGNEWFMPQYSTTSSTSNWSHETSPFCNLNAEKYPQLMEKPFVWAQLNEVADIYLRRTFTLNKPLEGDIFLACGYDDSPAEWYINGVQVVTIPGAPTNMAGWNIEAVKMLNDAEKALIKTDGSENVIAVHVHNNWGESIADCGLLMIEKPKQWVDTKDINTNFVNPTVLSFNHSK